MAEGYLRMYRYSDRYEAYSAGTEPGEVRPQAINVMKEIGITISHHRSKSVEEFRGKAFDYVITVCDHAKETCPFFPDGKEYIHRDFSDPSQCTDNKDEILTCFREVRDEIRRWIEGTFGNKKEKPI